MSRFFHMTDSALRAAKDLGEGLASVVFPPICAICEEPTRLRKPGNHDEKIPIASSRLYDTFCSPCHVSISQSAEMMRSACPTCAWPLGGRAGENLDSPTSPLYACPQCNARDVAMNFDRAAAVYRYQGVVCTAIVAAKYPRNTVLSRELSMRLAVESCRRWPCLIDQTSNERGPCELPTLVTSVPSPTWRQMRRGGSGTQVLARYFARWVRQAGGNVRYRSLLKTTRQISKQAWLDDQERRENVQGAFKLSPWIDWIRPLSSAPGVPRGESLSKQPLLGRDVILVDDVMTTGATANEIAGVLKAAGANRVSLAIVARAVRQS